MVDGATSVGVQPPPSAAALMAAKSPWLSPQTLRKASNAGPAKAGAAAHASAAAPATRVRGFISGGSFDGADDFLGSIGEIVGGDDVQSAAAQDRLAEFDIGALQANDQR